MNECCQGVQDNPNLIQLKKIKETQDELILDYGQLLKSVGRGGCFFLSFHQTDNKIDTFNINGHRVDVII